MGIPLGFKFTTNIVNYLFNLKEDYIRYYGKDLNNYYDKIIKNN